MRQKSPMPLNSTPYVNNKDPSGHELSESRRCSSTKGYWALWAYKPKPFPVPNVEAEMRRTHSEGSTMLSTTQDPKAWNHEQRFLFVSADIYT